jgi:hypothetical protein
MKIILLFLLFVPFFINAQHCVPMKGDTANFQAITKFVDVDADWYTSWLDFKDGKAVYPAPLEPSAKWQHPHMKNHLPSAMHEDSYASDISNFMGPSLENPKVQYFQVREKGGSFSGMCPSFAFVNDSTMVTLSFGRANTTLLILHIKDTIRLLDAMPIPGRGYGAMELAGKKSRMGLFRDTSGGAYFILTKNNEIFIPGPDYRIFYIPIQGREFERDRMVSYEIKEEIKRGDLTVEGLSDKEGENKLTALMPDSEGNIWYTSKLGIVGVIDLKNFEKGSYKSKGLCPNTYSHFIQEFGIVKKIEHLFGEKIDRIEDLSFYKKGETIDQFRLDFRKHFMIDPGTREEIQNSFSVGPDGVYVVSNVALYKLRFNDETKEIEMDPKWDKTFHESGDLIYANDFTQKKGHLNNGSGTTPTLLDDRFVIIADNDSSQINMNIFSQKDGSLVSRHKLFRPDSSACENSIVAYENSVIIGNTFNYTDPFKDNDTSGGINRFDYNESTGKFERQEDWPAEFIDAKTATPKMSSSSGLVYVYNRQEESDDGYHDWQLTALDFNTGRKVFYIRPEFEKDAFKDNISRVMKGFSLGNKHYEQKVFNNIWATYTFGPDNSIYIGTYRGFVKFYSDPKPATRANNP